ncbi:MAG: glycosyltransferase family 9 protein [Proteobacteria bacterium]|nr:glycosyltransferase family 9 protein [Pseudomonadota bacterium]
MPAFSMDHDSFCLLRLSALGDLVQTLPIAYALKRVWPDVDLTWIIGVQGRELLAAVEDIEFITFDKTAGLSEYLNLKRDLKGRIFDWLLHMQPTFRANLLAPFISARHKLGYDRMRSREGQYWVTNVHLESNPRQHAQENFLDFARYLGVIPIDEDWRLPVLPQAYESIHRLFSSFGCMGNYAVIHPAASDAARNWSSMRYAELARYLQHRGLVVIVTGGNHPHERSLVAEVVNASPGSVDFSGRLGLQELLALIQGAKLLIAPDTGPVHMADILRVPVIGLYAVSNPYSTGPWHQIDNVVNRYPDAVITMDRRSMEQVPFGSRVRQPGAMNLIGVDMVKAHVDRLLATP